MENVIDIAGRALSVPQKEKLPEGATAQVVTLSDAQAAIGIWFGAAFELVLAACPRWRYSLPTDEMVKAAVKVWIRALVNAGITDKKTVDAGIKRLGAANREYLPTVADFIAMCKDTGESRWPGLDTAKKEILLGMTKGVADRKWSCRFVAELARRSGSIFHHSTDKALRDIAFEAEYLSVLELAKSGYFDREEQVRVEHKTDPNLAYYFTLLRDFPNMPDLAQDHLKACADKGIIITVDLEKKTGIVTTADVSLVGMQTVGVNHD